MLKLKWLGSGSKKLSRQPRQDENKPARSVQRWCPCHHHQVMVLEMKVPRAIELAALKPVLPVFLSYVLSFIYLGIYWNNHHHLFQATKQVSGSILWANLHLLFWLSLFPFTTAWMGENHLAATPTAIYGFVLLMAAIRSEERRVGKECSL